MKKFKNWIIKKLGGYTEQTVIDHRITYDYFDTVPITLSTTIYNEDYNLIPSTILNEYRESILESLAKDLGKYLLDNNLVKVETDKFTDCTDLVVDRHTKITMLCRVVVPKNT
jgi:hypothetical protein